MGGDESLEARRIQVSIRVIFCSQTIACSVCFPPTTGNIFKGQEREMTTEPITVPLYTKVLQIHCLFSWYFNQVTIFVNRKKMNQNLWICLDNPTMTTELNTQMASNLKNK